VRAPDDAAPGKAVVRLILPNDCGLTSVPTDIPVELTAKDKPK